MLLCTIQIEYLLDTISKFETSKLPLTESINNWYCHKAFGTCPWRICSLTNSKLEKIMEKNPGFNALMSIMGKLFNKTQTNKNSEREYNLKL